MTFPVSIILTIIFSGFFFEFMRRICLKWHLHTEITRKVFHLYVGLIIIVYACYCQDIGQMLIVSMLILAWIVGIRSNASFKKRWGSQLFQIKRRSYGDLFIVPGLLLPLLMNQSMDSLVLASFLVVVLSDTGAALVGNFLLMNKLTRKRQKTIGGSLTFFLITFLICQGLLPGVSTGLILIVSINLSLVEAICPAGLDNLLLGLLTYILFKADVTVVLYLSLLSYATVSVTLIFSEQARLLSYRRAVGNKFCEVKDLLFNSGLLTTKIME